MEPFTSTLVRYINQARVNPDKSIERLGQLEKNYLGDELRYFNKTIDTFEGVAGLLDLKNHLSKSKSVKSLVYSQALSKVAHSIAESKGNAGRVDHQSPQVIFEKISAFANVQGRIGQLISVKATSSEEISAYFLIDDGLATRKRRRMLLDQKYSFIGIGTAYHQVHDLITVILLTENLTEGVKSQLKSSAFKKESQIYR